MIRMSLWELHCNTCPVHNNNSDSVARASSPPIFFFNGTTLKAQEGFGERLSSSSLFHKPSTSTRPLSLTTTQLVNNETTNRLPW